MLLSRSDCIFHSISQWHRFRLERRLDKWMWVSKSFDKLPAMAALNKWRHQFRGVACPELAWPFELEEKAGKSAGKSVQANFHARHAHKCQEVVDSLGWLV